MKRNRKPNKICPVCGSGYYIEPSAAHKRITCSLKCRSVVRIGSHKKTSAKIKRICEYCKKPFFAWPCRPSRFCSWECRVKYYRNHNFPTYSKISRMCLNCKRSFYKPPSLMGDTRKFCCKKCQIRYYKKNPTLHGRGPNWLVQRARALKRDNNICQKCGKSSLQIGSRRIEVHHKVPFRVFGIFRYKEANSLRNLITYCKKCHGLAEREYRKSERRKLGHISII